MQVMMIWITMMVSNLFVCMIDLFSCDYGSMICCVFEFIWDLLFN